MTSGKQNASTTSLPPLLPTTSTPPIRHNIVKKMSLAEMQLRREKGLCYLCDEKFNFNHKCPNRQLLLLLQTEKDDLAPDLLASNEATTCVPNSNTVPASDPLLSLNALKGGLSVGTIHFEDFINQLPIRVLVDGGSSDNFIQPRMAKFLKLPIEPVSTFRVMMGNGTHLAVEGMIQDLVIQVQGSTFELPVFVLPISGVDLILEARWLKTIGPHLANYESLQL